MKRLNKVLGFICFVACCAVAWCSFRFCGVLLVLASWTGAAVNFMDFNLEDEEEEPAHDSCEGCRHHLGGGCCDLNLEDECAAGGGYELWREEDEQ